MMEKINTKALLSFVFSILGGVILCCLSLMFAKEVETQQTTNDNTDYTQYYFARSGKIISIIKLIVVVIYCLALLCLI